LVHHTDRGSQYTADRYQAALAAARLTCSMSRTGDCYDNAMAESFFATFKDELIDRYRWPTRRAAQQAIFRMAGGVLQWAAPPRGARVSHTGRVRSTGGHDSDCVTATCLRNRGKSNERLWQ
jgi:transposase InsO family protein